MSFIENLTPMPSTDEVRLRTGRMLLSRLDKNLSNESILEVKNLKEALSIIESDYNSVISSIKSTFDQIADLDEYEQYKGSYVVVRAGYSESKITVVELYIQRKIKSDEVDDELETLVYKLFNFKESKFCSLVQTYIALSRINKFFWNKKS